MGCGCGGAKKTPVERVAQRRAATERQVSKRSTRTTWNGPKKKRAK